MDDHEKGPHALEQDHPALLLKATDDGSITSIVLGDLSGK